MKKTKTYRNCRFPAKVLAEADKVFESILDKKQSQSGPTLLTLTVWIGEEHWHFDTINEFLAAADQGITEYYKGYTQPARRLSVSHFPYCDAAVEAPTRDEIETVFAVFDRHAPQCQLPEDETEQKESKPIVFIGHGHDPQWRDLKDHLHEQHGYDVEAYEIGSRAGHTIRDILEEMLERSSFALLVMTGEDETREGKTLARQNVVHEAGLFQGRLGFGRAIILLEEGTEEFSNIQGVHQIRFSKGRIREAFGDVLAVLRREFGQT
jgi:predicted nucleotide-binding protein